MALKSSITFIQHQSLILFLISVYTYIVLLNQIKFKLSKLTTFLLFASVYLVNLTAAKRLDTFREKLS